MYSPIYGGIGKITSNQFALARPSFALTLDKNALGENDIKIVPLIPSRLYFFFL